MTVAAKLQIKPGQSISIMGDRRGAELDVGEGEADDSAADGVLVFCANRPELDRLHEQFVAAARRDALTWLAYPKGGQLGTDLSRDSLRDLLAADAIRPVRQVALDDVWSALRFRPS
jgi:hypothetical protein